jgi:CspA family cold shock protein
MPKGIVKWFNNTMKYGFIISEEGKEIFVHFSEIQMEGYKTLKRGDVVSYEIEETEKGIKAVQVVKVASAPAKKTQEHNEERNHLRRSA